MLLSVHICYNFSAKCVASHKNVVIEYLVPSNRESGTYMQVLHLTITIPVVSYRIRHVRTIIS